MANVRKKQIENVQGNDSNTNNTSTAKKAENNREQEIEQMTIGQVVDETKEIVSSDEIARSDEDDSSENATDLESSNDDAESKDSKEETQAPPKKRMTSAERRAKMQAEAQQREKESEEWRKRNKEIFDSVLAFAKTDDIGDLEEDYNDVEPERLIKITQTQREKTKVTFTQKKNNISGGIGAIDELVNSQRAYFESSVTIPQNWRGRALLRFSTLIKKYEEPLIEALHRDLGISKYEAYMTEIAPVYEELNIVREKYRPWTKKKRARIAFKMFPAFTRTDWHPLGCACIINSWQSPVAGAVIPMVSALAAGCTITVKNSSRTRRVNEVLAAAIDELFKPECVKFIYGEDDLDRALGSARFNKIFYCGSREGATEVLHGAAENLAKPTILIEGNNPCYVDQTVDLKMAAKRIMWGKMIHAGQTRLTPSWVICHESVQKAFINRLYEYVKNTYGENPIESDDYPRMFSRKEYEQACSLIDNLGSKANVIFGGERDAKTLRIAPTVILVDTINHPIFKKKIIGPILPVVAYKRPEDAFDEIGKLPTPPALYLFTNNKPAIRYASFYVEYGCGCINDTLMQVANRFSSRYMMGNAGFGAVGGKAGVEEFGIRKLITKSNKRFTQSFRFPPFPQDIKKIQRKYKLKSNR